MSKLLIGALQKFFPQINKSMRNLEPSTTSPQKYLSENTQKNVIYGLVELSCIYFWQASHHLTEDPIWKSRKVFYEGFFHLK